MKDRHDSGSVMMEAVILMPMLFILIMGVLQLAQIWTARQVVKYAAYCAARATLTSNKYTAYFHAYEAARQVCAWITYSETAEELAANRAPRAALWWESDSFGVNEARLFVYSMALNSFSMNSPGEVEVPGWGKIPHSSSVDRRLRVFAGLKEPYNILNPWESRAVVEFDFPLLMPVAGKMFSYLVNMDAYELDDKLETGEVGVKIGSGWTGQQTVLDSEKGLEPYAFPYITLREVCILPKPYSTAVYPCTSFDLDKGLSGVLK